MGFLVLPDRPGTERIAYGKKCVTHPGGGPWLVAEEGDRIATAEAGRARLAVVGGSGRLDELVGRLREAADIPRVFAALRGAAYIFASVGGHVRVQGDATGVHVLFHTTVDGVPVASDRADLLATMTGRAVDEEALALRVVCGPQLPAPAGSRPLWRHVRSVPPGHHLAWDREHERVARHWEPPAADLSLAAAAGEVHDALATATAHEGDGISTDLSGGMDSTSLTFLAARHSPGLLTFRWGESEAGNDDALYAALAIDALSDARHLVLSPRDTPATFADVESFADPEQPHPITRTLARVRHAARYLAAHGSRQHLSGHGGDELFMPLHGYLHGLLRRRPVAALRTVRAYAALYRWPLLPSIAALTRPGDPSSWWRAQAEQLTGPPPLRQPMLGWGFGWLRAHGWVTREAVDLCRTGLLRAAEQARPLAPDPGVHQLLLLLQANAGHYRMLGRIYAEAGIRLRLPFYDDRVLAAVLRVPQADHAGPWRYKPLLAEAMRGTVPEPLLGRGTKGEFSEDLRTGLNTHLPAILDLFADSALAECGLIDPVALRRQVTGPQQHNRTVVALESLIGCEIWLRAARRNDTLEEPCSVSTPTLY